MSRDVHQNIANEWMNNAVYFISDKASHRLERLFWIIVISCGFFCASLLLWDAFEDWVENPTGTEPARQILWSTTTLSVVYLGQAIRGNIITLGHSCASVCVCLYVMGGCDGRKRNPERENFAVQPIASRPAHFIHIRVAFHSVTRFFCVWDNI